MTSALKFYITKSNITAAAKCVRSSTKEGATK